MNTKIIFIAVITVFFFIPLIGDIYPNPPTFPGLSPKESYIYFCGVSIKHLINYADVAGVGRFMNQPVPHDNIVNVYVDDSWLGDFQDEIIPIHTMWHNFYPDEYPTNIPVVFFAKYKIWEKSSYDIDENTGVFTFSNETITNTIPTFIDGDSAWFVKSMDNGLMFDYTTNLWENIRINPNFTNCYNIYVDANKKRKNSDRLRNDLSSSFRQFLEENSKQFFIDKYNEPNLPKDEKDMLFSGFLREWQSYTNSVLNMPPWVQ